MSHRESMEEDDMVMRVGSSLGKRERRTDEESKEGRRPEELIRRCQGLAEGYPWQPRRAPGRATE